MTPCIFVNICQRFEFLIIQYVSNKNTLRLYYEEQIFKIVKVITIVYSDKYKKFISTVYIQNVAVYNVQRGGIHCNYNDLNVSYHTTGAIIAIKWRRGFLK
jgi:hypothetical protein